MPKLVVLDRRFYTSDFASTGLNGMSLAFRELSMALGVENKISFCVVAAELPFLNLLMCILALLKSTWSQLRPMASLTRRAWT